MTLVPYDLWTADLQRRGDDEFVDSYRQALRNFAKATMDPLLRSDGRRIARLRARDAELAAMRETV